MLLTILCVAQYNAIHDKTMDDPNFEKLTLELRRGIIALAVLSQLDEEQYGYSLIQLLAEKGLQVEQVPGG